jgi:hypothetical protein
MYHAAVVIRSYFGVVSSGGIGVAIPLDALAENKVSCRALNRPVWPMKEPSPL